jgi:hypothetical protein
MYPDSSAWKEPENGTAGKESKWISEYTGTKVVLFAYESRIE